MGHVAVRKQARTETEQEKRQRHRQRQRETIDNRQTLQANITDKDKELRTETEQEKRQRHRQRQRQIHTYTKDVLMYGMNA